MNNLVHDFRLNNIERLILPVFGLVFLLVAVYFINIFLVKVLVYQSQKLTKNLAFRLF